MTEEIEGLGQTRSMLGAIGAKNRRDKIKKKIAYRAYYAPTHICGT